MKKTGGGHVYMKLDRIRNISGASAPKARSMGLLPKIAIMYRSWRILCGILMIGAFAWLADEYLVTGDVKPKCWFCTASDRAAVPGIVTRLDCIGYGPKNRNDYRVEYSYMVGGKTYTGVGYQTGLGYLEKQAVTVDYMLKDPSCSCVREIRCAADNAMFTVMFGGILPVAGVILLVIGVLRLRNALWVIEHGAVAMAAVGNIARKTRRIGTLKGAVFSTSWTASCSYKDASGANHAVEVGTPGGLLKKGDTVSVVYDPGMPENALAVGALPWFVKTDPPLG